MLPRLFSAVVLVLGLSTSLQAQYNNMRRVQPGRQPMAVKPTEIKIEGVIEGVMRGGIALLDKNNQLWRVIVPPIANMHVSGSATPDFLQTGLIVELKAEIDGHGAIKDKVDELTIVTLSPERQMGLFPSEAAGEHADVVAGGEADGGGPSRKPAKRSSRGTAGATPAGTYRIVGRLIVGRGGKTSVHTGRNSLPFELAEQPTVSIDSADYLLASKGDKADITSVDDYRPAGPGPSNGRKDRVGRAAGWRKKKMPVRPEAKHPPKRPKKDEGLSEPAAEK